MQSTSILVPKRSGRNGGLVIGGWRSSWIGVLFLVVLVTACKSTSKTNQTQPLPSGWVDWNTPDRVKTLARACASNSNVVNSVAALGNSIQIHSETEGITRFSGFLEEPLPFAFHPNDGSGARRVLQVKDGWLIGYNKGEFGGSLWRTDTTGKQSWKLLNENVTQFATAFGRMYAFTNAAGQGFSGGSIYRISEDGRIGESVDFTGAPVALAQDRDSLLVVTRDAVHRVRPDLKNDESLSQTELWGFIPNSIAKAGDGSIFVGMRFFVLRLIASNDGFREQWLVQASCNQFHVVPEKRDCVCDGP